MFGNEQERIVHALIRETGDLADLVESEEKIEAVPEDPEDNRILECAVESGASVIVSGDSRFSLIGASKLRKN